MIRQVPREPVENSPQLRGWASNPPYPGLVPWQATLAYPRIHRLKPGRLKLAKEQDATRIRYASFRPWPTRFASGWISRAWGGIAYARDSMAVRIASLPPTHGQSQGRCPEHEPLPGRTISRVWCRASHPGRAFMVSQCRSTKSRTHPTHGTDLDVSMAMGKAHGRRGDTSLVNSLPHPEHPSRELHPLFGLPLHLRLGPTWSRALTLSRVSCRLPTGLGPSFALAGFGCASTPGSALVAAGRMESWNPSPRRRMSLRTPLKYGGGSHIPASVGTAKARGLGKD